ncbi:Proteasome component ECM29 [Zancudomyces culisetae]|uniref:Proteasome component ECM29 n=1 Tax=Zancudomyces culisetae TaxID=1213189 RepID=A0A1R1PJ20_ZANCU|nr:Proteasome component ECM29 [Zancudomyces culisetae]|eukprot:OMH80956.1 Proteasome component ECM29 [Zancudomyces culisetae]
MTVDIMENKFRVSEHNSVKLCVLRLATEGLDFSNIRAKQLCVYGSGSEDSSVRYAALAGLSLDVSKILYKLPAVYQDSLLSSNLEEDRKWVKAYKETLPNVVEWVEMVFTITNSWNNHILNGESDESKGHIGNFALNSLSRKHMFGFTMQLLTVCGLCTIIESDSEKIYSVPQWVISDDSYGVEEAIKILKSWESANFALNKLFSELNLRKALWVYLNNVFNIPENNKKIIESVLICMTPRASPKDKEKHPRTVNSGDDVKASTILRIFSTLGSKTLVGILLQNWEVLYEIGTASVDHRIYTNIAASLGILSMRKCLTCKNPGEFCMNTVEFNHYLDLTNQHLLQLKDEYNKTQFSTLSTHIEHPDSPKVGTLMDTHTILFKLITMGFLISRLKLISNIEESVDKKCQPMVDSAISLYQELSGHILKGIYLEMKSTKNASKRYTSVVFRDVCLGLCEFGKFGCLNLEFKEPNVLFYLVEILKTGKLEYKDLRMALKALSSIAMGLGIGKEGSEFSELHLEIVKVFSELTGSRKTNFMKLDVQLIVSDFIPLVFAMWNSNLSKVQYEGCLEFPFSKLAGILSPGVWDYLVSEQLPKMAKSQLSTERFAAACWIFNLSYYCQTSSFMVSNGITLHKLVCDLLVDVDETTQSVAGKCLSNLYILNASKAARDEMLYNVIGSLGVRRPAAPIGGGSGSTGPLSELRTAINPSSSTTSGTDLRRNLNSNVVATYRTILNLAMDIKSPDLFYKLVILAGSGIDTQISIGPSSYAALLVKWARDSALEAATPLVPKLYIECFNTNTMIAKAMNIIWQSCFKTTAPNVALNHDSTLISPFSSVVLKHWDTIFKECTLALNSHDYKSRLAGCNSLSSILSLTDNIKRFEKHLNQLWALLFRLLDDMNDSVRAEALKLANSLSNTILAWCESGSLNAGEMVENDQNPLNLVETVVNVVLGSGLSNPAAEVREFCISFLDKLTRLELSKPFSCVISIKLLESLSENENSIVNYFIQNANNWNISVDQIEYARVSATTSSPSMRIIQRCLDNLDHSNLGVFCHDLAKITKHSLSLPSRVGVAKVIMDLCVNRRDEMYDHALILTRAVLAQLTKSTGVEVSIWSNAIAYTCPFLTLEKLEKLMSRIATIYLDNPKSADKRLVSLNVLYQISKRDVDLSSNNLVFSLLYVAKFDENTQISKLASDCIANTAAYFHASAIKKHTSDIISSFIGPMLHSGDFSQINHASVVISDLAKQSIFNPKQLQQSNASTHINTIERQKSLVETRTRSFTSIDPSEFAFLSQLVPLIHELLNLLSSRRFFDGKISAVEALCKLAIVLEPILSTNEYKESPEKLSGLNLEEIYHFMLSLINSNNTSSNVVFKKFALANACALLKYSDSLNAKFSNEFLSLLLSLLTGSSFSTTTSLAGDSRNTSTDIGTSSSPKPAVLALQAVCINGISEILPINTALSTAQYLEILEALFPFCKETPWIVKHAAAQSFLDVFYHYLFNFTRIESTEPRVFLLVHDFLALSSSDIKHSSIKLVALDLCSIILEKRPVLNNNASSSASAIQSLYAKCKDVLITLSTSDPDVRVKNEAKHIFSTI